MAARRFLTWLLRPATCLSLLGLASLGVLTLTLKQPFYLNILALTLFYAAASSAWNLLGGFAGQLSLGHTAFFGIGAYTSTLLYLEHGLSPWWGMLIGGGLASAFAVLVAYPCFRLRGPFFALATIALAEVLRILAMHFRELTKGGVGLSIPFRPGLANFIFPDKTGYAVVAFLFLVVMIGVGYLIKRSRVGYYLAALRDDPEAAEAAGINTTACKLLVMVVSAFFTALAGTFYAQYVTFIDPDIVFSMNFSVQLALLPIIGGLGAILGPVLGAFILTPLDALLRAWLGGVFAGLSFIIYGLLLIVVVIYLPEGLLFYLRRRVGPWLDRRPTFPPAPADPPAVPAPAAPPVEGPIFEVRALSKSFGGLKAVSQVDFQVRSGEILGLIGPNGAGKTTIFNLISGFLSPDQGSILFLGRDLARLRPPHRVARRGIGRTFQIVKPFANMTVLENVMVGAFARTARVAEARARALETLELVGLSRYREYLAASLSIGDRKRLELAKALAARPRLLLLDEVMGGLAPPEVTAMIHLLRRVAAGGVTMVLIEHVMKAVMSLSDRVVVLQNGQVIAAGPPEEIGRDPRVIEAYLGEEYRHAAGG